MTEKQTNLGEMLRCFMAMHRWSMRPLAKEIGVSSATLCRVCAGQAMDAATLVKIINWMTRAANPTSAAPSSKSDI